MADFVFQGLVVLELNVALLNLDDAIAIQARHHSTHCFEGQPEIAADLFAGHAQAEACG